jgi:hypothetical protein
MQRKYRRRQMFALVEAYRKGNQSRREFCTRHNVSLSTFGWWQKRYRIARSAEKVGKTGSEPGFLRIMAAPQTASFELCFTDGTVMRFPAGIEDERLVSIFRQVRDGQRCSVS